VNRTRHIRHSAGILAGLASALLVSITTAPATFATTSPRPAGPAVPAPEKPARVHAALAGGMPAWQITLIAVGAAVLAAAIAVLLTRAQAARRPVTPTAA
jgi:hypothetical protein